MKLYPPCAASVLALGLHVDPAAVAWLVVPVVVDPVQGESWRALPHVCKEGFETAFPAVAHNNSAASVPIESGDVGVVASRLGMMPRSIFASPCQEVGSLLSAVVGAKAPATFGFTAYDLLYVNAFGCAAIASAEPFSSAGGVVNRNHIEPTVNRSDILGRFIVHGLMISRDKVVSPMRL